MPDEPRMSEREFWEKLIRHLLAIVYLLAKRKGVLIERAKEEK